MSFTTPVGDPDCVLVAAGLRGRGSSTSFSVCLLEREVGTLISLTGLLLFLRYSAVCSGG